METLLEFNFFSFFTYAMNAALLTEWCECYTDLAHSSTCWPCITHPPAAKQLKAS